MNIAEFASKYSHEAKPINSILRKWTGEKIVCVFLKSKVNGIPIGQILTDFIEDGNNGRFRYFIPKEVKSAFTELMGEKADSYFEVKQILIEKYLKGDHSFEGLVSTIQGKLGELVFKESIGKAARLAENPSQVGWDIVVNETTTPQFIQVKIYDDVDRVVQKIKEVNEKIQAGLITDENGELVESIDFAVNSDVYSEVCERTEALGLNCKIMDIGASREEIRNYIYEANEDISNPLGHFFSELCPEIDLFMACKAAQAFLLWKQASSASEFITGLCNSTLPLAGRIAAKKVVENIAIEAVALAELEVAVAILTGPVGGVLFYGAGWGIYETLKRFSERRFVAQRLNSMNERLSDLCFKFEVVNTKSRLSVAQPTS